MIRGKIKRGEGKGEKERKERDDEGGEKGL